MVLWPDIAEASCPELVADVQHVKRVAGSAGILALGKLIL